MNPVDALKRMPLGAEVSVADCVWVRVRGGWAPNGNRGIRLMPSPALAKHRLMWETECQRAEAVAWEIERAALRLAQREVSA